MGPIKLGDLRPGQWRDLTPNEVEKLKGAAN
jgi:23S rRNA pseudouridine2457 synthase